MPVPLALPLVLLGGGGLIAAAAGASSKKKKAKVAPSPSPNGTTYTLDANMPVNLRDQVLAALATEKDANKLDAFASAIASVFPMAAAALRARAALVRASQPSPAPRPPEPLPPGQLPQLQNVDAGFPPEFIPALQATYQDTDPARIDAYAATIGMAYPIAASLLRARAAQLRAAMPQPPSPAPMPSPAPTPMPSPPMPSPVYTPEPLPAGQLPQRQNVDAGFPPELVVPLQTAYQDTDPGRIEAYASAMDRMGYPIAASLLRARAAQLRAAPAPAPVPPTPGPFVPPPAPTPQPPMPSPSLPNVVLPPMQGLDPGMPVEMQKAVLGALTTEGDAAKLQGFAQSIQAQYPIAAGLLMAKANALLLMKPPFPAPPAPPQPGPVVPPMPPRPPMPQPQALYPLGDASTHTGRNAGRPTGQYPFVVLGTKGPGNAPITIAKYGAGSEAEWPKLKPLNPQYRFGVEPEFIGQALNVPWDWAPKLASAGYTVEQDAGAQPPVPVLGPAPRAALPMMNGGSHASHS